MSNDRMTSKGLGGARPSPPDATATACDGARSRVTFRRQARETGLARVVARPREHLLMFEGKEMARVARRRPEGDFFFYGKSQCGARINTLVDPWRGKQTWGTEAEARAACKDFFINDGRPNASPNRGGTSGREEDARRRVLGKPEASSVSEHSTPGAPPKEGT
jgi:hypothetical protein